MWSRAYLVVVTTSSFLSFSQMRAEAAQHAPARPGDVVELDTVTITSTKTSEPVIDALAGSTVVTQDKIATIQPSKASEILRDIPSVTTQESPNEL